MILPNVFKSFLQFFKGQRISIDYESLENGVVVLNEAWYECSADCICKERKDIKSCSPRDKNMLLFAFESEDKAISKQICIDCFSKINVIIALEENMRNDDNILNLKTSFGLKTDQFYVSEPNENPDHLYFDKFLFKKLESSEENEFEKSEDPVDIDSVLLNDECVIILSYIVINDKYYIHEIISKNIIQDEKIFVDNYSPVLYKVFIGVTIINLAILSVKILKFLARCLKNRSRTLASSRIETKL